MNNYSLTSRIRWASGGAIGAALAFGVAFAAREHLGRAPADLAPKLAPDPAQHGAHPGQGEEHAGHATSGARAAVHLEPERAAMLGVVVEAVRRGRVAEELRAVAVVVPDESRLSHVHARVSGFIENLYVGTTGATVKRGQPIADVFSRELLAAQGEYLVLARLASAAGPGALESARDRLEVLGMGRGGVAALERRGKPLRSVSVVAPRGGVVLHRGVSAGAAVDPGTELVTIADLSRVWVLAEVPEAHIADVALGRKATLDLPGSGLGPFEAKVAFIYPTLSERTRTLRVRFEVPNDHKRLLPGIYGTAELGEVRSNVLTISRDAVVDTGSERHVFVVHGDNHYMPHTVVLGATTGDRVEVREGLEEGERVVASGVFLLDSESRLRASGGAAGHQHH